MRLSCADYTWPLLPHAGALDLIRALDCDAVDIGFMSLRSHVRPEQSHGRIAATAGAVRERVESRGLAVADVFAIPYTDFETMAANNPDSGRAGALTRLLPRCGRVRRARSGPRG